MDTKPPIPLAFLLGIQTPDVDDIAHEAASRSLYHDARVWSEEYDEIGRVLKGLGLPGAITRLKRSLAAH